MQFRSIPCRCGKTKKNFKFNIGPFFIDACCKQAGYDEKGDLKDGTTIDPSVSLSTSEIDTALQAQTPKASASLPAPVEQDCGTRQRQLNDNPLPPLRPGRGKLMDASRPELNEIAKGLGITDIENKNKRLLVEAILDARG